MRKLLSLAVGFLFAGGLVWGQTHDNMTEKAVKDVIVFTSDVKVGATILPAGEYRVMCDTKKITFARLVAAKDQESKDLLDPITRVQVIDHTGAVKVLEVPCKGRE